MIDFRKIQYFFFNYLKKHCNKIKKHKIIAHISLNVNHTITTFAPLEHASNNEYSKKHFIGTYICF